MAINDFECIVDEGNERCKKMMEKLGFEIISTIEDYRYDKIHAGGRTVHLYHKTLE